jgi:hypothetical protein
MDKKVGYSSPYDHDLYGGQQQKVPELEGPSDAILIVYIGLVIFGCLTSLLAFFL